MTFILLKTNFGKTIGAYTPLMWNGTSKYQTDKSGSSFLLQLDLLEKYPIKDNAKVIYRDHNTGPIFGDSDLYISDLSN